jgi:hypothetical protein
MRDWRLLAILWVAAIVYGLWSFFVASRYQSLCQLSYWSATEAQLRACDDQRVQLPKN